MKNHKDHRGSSGEERQRWHEWGVSEVIGVVLLLSLVVVGGTIVGTQLLSQPAPKEIPNVNFLANYDSGQNYTTLYHTGGDTLRAGDYHFVVQYSGTSKPVTVKPTGDWQSGQRLPLPDASGEPYKVTLVYTGKGAGETALRSVVIGATGLEAQGSTQSGESNETTTTATTVVTTTQTTVATTETTIPTTEPTTTTPPSPQVHTINATNGSHGTISPRGLVQVLNDTAQAFEFAHDTGYHLANLTVDSVTTVPTSEGPYTFKNVTQDHSIAAAFDINHYTITVTEPQHGSITPYGTVDVVYGDTPTFTFTPDTGYRLGTVTVDREPVTISGTTYTFPPVNTSHTLAATFEAITCTINVSASQGGNVTAVTSRGTVIIPPGTANQQITVTYGEQPTFTFTPDEGSHIADVVINGFSKGSVATYSFPLPVVDNSNTVVATFAANIYSVNVTSGQNGSVQANDLTVNAGTTGTVNVGYNGQVNFTYLPITGHHIDTVSYTAEDGSLKELPIENNASVLSGIKSNTTVVANFAIDTFAITVNPAEHGTITPNGTQTVDYNSTPTFTFTPDTGYHLAGVTVDGTPVTPAGNTYTFPPVTAPHTLEATFAIDTFTINATVGDHGAINPNGTITVNYGDSREFTITADTGYHITSVMVDNSPLTVPAGNTSYPYTFSTITSDHTINASFAINTYTINATAGEHGTITPNGTLTVDYGSSKTFTITPETGYKITDVIVDGVSQGAIATYELSSIQSDHTISASFEQIMYTITANTGPLGTITPSGSLSYAYHAAPSFTVGAIPGYHIVNIIVDNVRLDPTSNYTFAPLEGDHTITADFAKNVYTITATAGDGGTITPEGNVLVEYGDDLVFTITPGKDNTIDDVVVDGVSQGAVSSFPFPQVDMNHTIEAYFNINGVGPYTIEGYVSNGFPTKHKPYWDETAPRLGGWTVQALVGQGKDWSVIRTAVTDENGYYIMDHMPKDHYHVQLVLQPGWEQTYPSDPKYYDVTNLNHGHQDEWVYFMVHPTGEAGEGQILLNNPSNIGVMKDGTFIQFTGNHWVEWPQPTQTDDWIQMDSSATLASGLDMDPNQAYRIRIPWQTTVKIVMNGDQAKGQIYIINNNQISTFAFDNVKVYFNGNLVATGKITGIWVNTPANLLSTLTYVMGTENSGAQFVVDGKDVIKPAWWPLQKWGVTVYGISPRSAQAQDNQNILNFNYDNQKTYLICSGGYALFRS